MHRTALVVAALVAATALAQSEPSDAIQPQLVEAPLEEQLVEPVSDGPVADAPFDPQTAPGALEPQTVEAPFEARLVATPEQAEAERQKREERARADTTRPKIDPRLIGRWRLRIATGVSYVTDGSSTYRRIEPGADLDHLEV